LHLPGDFLPTVTQQALGSASANAPGYPLRLSSVQLFLIKMMKISNGQTSAAAGILITKQDKNPFFKYLADGSTLPVRNLLLSLCPSPDSYSLGRHQWAWERDQAEEAWKDSMYWDCIFLAKLL
jgi:hypothetical protein